jgi:arylsulfatase A-like enzyme
MYVQRAWLRRSASVIALFAVAKLAILCVLLLPEGGAGVLARTSTGAIEHRLGSGTGGAIEPLIRMALWPPALIEADARALGLWLLIEAVVAGACLLVSRMLRHERRETVVATGERILWIAFAALAAYTAINVPVARVMGTPLTYTILRTVGGALSDSIRVYFTASNLLAAGAVLASACALPALMGRALSRVRPARVALLWIPILGLLLAAGPAARRRVDLGALPRNAAQTLLTTTLAQHFATRAPRALPPLPLVSERAEGQGSGLDLSALRGAARGRSVIWVVLESTAASYLRPFGGAASGPDPTPALSELAAEGVVFDAAYAAYPESIKGLYSLLCSAAPAAHTPAERYTAARIPCSPLAEQLRAVGYRTAMFHSGWFAYLGMAGVVADRGFDVLADAGVIGGAYATSFGVDEQSTVQRLLRFIDLEPAGSPARRPFFAMYLPIAGHHPYSAPGPTERPMPFGRETDYQLYLNDLRFGDQALGALRAALKERGLDDRILWIVSGDHGEAFQQHPGNFAHTLHLYDENVRVPLLIAAPGHPSFVVLRSAAGQGAARGLHAPQVASLIDVAPTLMELIGLPPPRDWQGLSLLAPAAERAVRFLTDHGLLQLGLRQGPWKFIDEVETGRARLFDLRADPTELHDVAEHEAARVRAYRQHLRAWADAQRARW